MPHTYVELVTTRAVLFDFSGTLFRLEEDESWLDDLVGEGGVPFDVAGKAEIMRRMTAPSGMIPQLGDEYRDAWENRDLDPAQHRKAYLGVLLASGVPEEHARALYARLIDPDCWTPYPDAGEVLRGLRTAGIKVGVISNIAFDIRPAFDKFGFTEHVDEFLLSYEEGVIKPDQKIFLRACERLDVQPEEALMIGDSAEADGGATAVGCRFVRVDPVPTAQRPDALRAAVADLLG